MSHVLTFQSHNFGRVGAVLPLEVYHDTCKITGKVVYLSDLGIQINTGLNLKLLRSQQFEVFSSVRTWCLKLFKQTQIDHQPRNPWKTSTHPGKWRTKYWYKSFLNHSNSPLWVTTHKSIHHRSERKIHLEKSSPKCSPRRNQNFWRNNHGVSTWRVRYSHPLSSWTLQHVLECKKNEVIAKLWICSVSE